jgi:hypothetical protein
MSTPRKLDGRRIGFSIDRYGRERTDGRSGAWTDGIRREARWGYLQALSRECRDVLATLRTIPPDDEAALLEWASRWGLVSSDPADDWAIAHARATRRLCAQYSITCWFDRDDLSGFQCPDDLSEVPLESRPLRHADHFRWLARFQCGAGWAKVEPGTPIKTVRDAVTSLAANLLLQLRPTRRGRPSTK